MMASNRRPGWWTGAFIAPTTNYCRRANTLAAYADVNKSALMPKLDAPHCYPAISHVVLGRVRKELHTSALPDIFLWESLHFH